MTPNDKDFYDLCLALRKLGALEVETEGRKVRFSQSIPKSAVEMNSSYVPDSEFEKFPKK